MQIKQGANKNFKFFVYVKGSQTPNLQPPRNVVFTAQKTANCGCGEIVLQKSLNNGITFNSETGKYTLAFLPEDTIGIEPGNYAFDIKIARADLQYFVVNQGYLKITKAYTGLIIGGQ